MAAAAMPAGGHSTQTMAAHAAAWSGEEQQLQLQQQGGKEAAPEQRQLLVQVDGLQQRTAAARTKPACIQP